jgi:flagellin-specific chaperone FliS
MPEPSKTDIYKLRDLQSAGKMKSIILLLEGCLIHCKQAREDEAGRAGHLEKARNIIAQLELSVNIQSGEAARNIFFLYDYLYDQLALATGTGIQISINLLRDLIGMMREVERKG